MTGRARKLEDIESRQRARAQRKPDFLDGQIARRATLPGLVDLTAGKPPRAIEWLVEGRIPMRQTTIMAGPGGDGKSFVALQLAVACAAGTQWLGLDVRHCPAVVYACEDDDAILYDRTERISAYHGFEIVDLEDLMVCSGVGTDNELVKFARFDPKGEPTDLLARIENAATQANAGLLILDSLHDLFLGNEIDRAQARSFIRHLTAAAQSIECAILLIAHPSRSGMREGSGQSGSTAWFNSARSFLHVKREPKSSARRLEHSKNQYGPLAPDLEFEWSDDHGIFVPIGEDHDGVSSRAAARLKDEYQRALKILHDLIAEHGETRWIGVTKSNRHAVSLDLWREHLLRRGVTDRETPSASRQMFRRIKEKLSNSALIGIGDGYVWSACDGA